MRQVALRKHLRLFAIGRRRQCHDTEPRGLTLSVIALIVPPFPGGVPPLEHNDDARYPVSFTQSWSRQSLHLQSVKLSFRNPCA